MLMERGWVVKLVGLREGRRGLLEGGLSGPGGSAEVERGAEDEEGAWSVVPGDVTGRGEGGVHQEEREPRGRGVEGDGDDRMRGGRPTPRYLGRRGRVVEYNSSGNRRQSAQRETKD